MAKRGLKRSAILVAFLLAGVATGFSQLNTGTITGAVTDPSGAVIPGARIVITNDQTGLTRTATSNPAGQYTAGFLPIGPYSAVITAKGFASQTRRSLQLSASQVLTLDFKLRIGTAAQTVTVTSGQTLMNYTSPEQRTTLGTTNVHQLPLSKQDWSSLLSTSVPGVHSAVDSVSMNGLPPGAMNLTVDGTDAQTDPEMPTLGSYQSFNSINTINTAAIAQISVTKGIAPASAGSGMAGNINIITRGGTNQFHGSAFEYNQISALDARNPFLSNKPRTVFNEFGGSLGGPIMKNRLFFFGSYEGVQNPAFSLTSGDVPTPEFVKSTLAVAPEYAPVFDAFPAPNQPYAPDAITGFYESAGSDTKNDNNTVARLDYNINSANQLTLRFTRGRPFRNQPNLISINPRTYIGKSNMYNAQFTHSAGVWTAATRFGLNWTNEQRLDHGFASGLDQIQFSGFDSSGAEDFELFGKTLTFQEDVSFIHGRHTVSFGGIVQYFDNGRIDDSTNSFSYSNLSDFLGNIPSQIQVNFPLSKFLMHRWQYGGYVQDDFRMRPNLTLNFGLRYDYWTVPKERDGRIFTRDPGPLVPGTGPLRPPSQMFRSSWPNFAPRLGFSWSPWPDRKTVIRAGFGLFYSVNTIRGGLLDDVLDNPFVPFRLTLDRGQALAMGLNFPVDKDALQQQLISDQSPVATTAFNNDMPNPYSIQYTLDVQRDLGGGFILDSTYIGTRGIHLDLIEQVNLPDRLTGAVPAPEFGGFRYYDPSSRSNYNAWQTSLRKRMQNGLQFGANYTWARSLGLDSAADLDLNDSSKIPYGSDVRADYGPTNYDIPSYFSANFVYQLPFMRFTQSGGNVMSQILGGWQVSGILTGAAGSPNNITNGSSSYPNDRPDRAPGVNPILSHYSKTLQYGNPAAFLQIPIVPVSGAQEGFGNLSRNFLRGPGMWNLDLGAAKSFSLWEGADLQFRVDAFNSFNHRNLSGLRTDVSSGSFGRLTNSTARVVQLGGRLTF